VRRRRSLRPWTARGQQRRLEARYLASISRQVGNDVREGRIRGPADLHDRVMEAMESALTPGWDRSPHRMARFVREFMPVAIASSAEMLSTMVANGMEAYLVSEEAERTEFEAFLYDKWGPVLNLLTSFQDLCMQAGRDFGERHSSDEQTWTFQALHLLHARACLVTGEVIALLRAGYASGAHARWRTAHEIVVTAMFIAKHGEDVAERFLHHNVIESYRAAEELRTVASRLDEDPVSDLEMAELRESRDALIVRYGEPYGKGSPGWAAEALRIRKPSIVDIERAVSLDHIRPYYRMASHATHAVSKSLLFDLGSPDEYFVVGSSTAGLADPAQSIVISLLQVTTTLLAYDLDLGDSAVMVMLKQMCDVAVDVTISCHHALMREAEEHTQANQEFDFSRPPGTAEP
jgi:hypothetical protein